MLSFQLCECSFMFNQEETACDRGLIYVSEGGGGALGIDEQRVLK